MSSDLFFVIHSDSSANSARGLVPLVATMTRDEIIDLAWAKVDRRGESLYPLAEAASAAGYSDDQLLSLSVEELGEDGRLFLIFSESEVEDFIEDAARFGVLEEAREVLAEVRGRTVLQITKAEWRKTHRDFKSVIDGQRYVLRMTKHGTALIPVELLKE